MKKILIVFGTRPEAIKLAPLINQLKSLSYRFETVVCVSAQHRQMLDSVLQFFDIVPDYDLDIMSPNQDLFDITINVLSRLKEVFEKEKPDILIAQGDTTTTFVASLAAFYFRVPIAHVEAGLRTYDKYQPFPEEKNRHMATALADYHFVPTEQAKQNLLKEGIPKDKIWLTGNTSIDALLTVVSDQKSVGRQETLNRYFKENWDFTLTAGNGNSRVILVTGHRRENFGKGFKNICKALKSIAENNPDVKLVYPVHLNPNVRRPVFEIFGDSQGNIKRKKNKNIYLIEPLDYQFFVFLMDHAYLILTDSGGIQEEAPSLGKPVLVMRNITERSEGIKAGGAKLVGTDCKEIISETQRLLNDKDAYQKMASIKNPYGDGQATSRIVEILEKEF